MTNVSIVGHGYWGGNLLRNFNELDCNVISLCEKDPQKLEKVIKDKRYKHIQKTTKLEDVINNKEIDAVAIVTPTATHYEIAKQCLVNGKHVFVEKPMTYNPQESLDLIRLAEKSGKILMVGNIMLYNKAFNYIKDHLSDIGNIRYINSLRLNLGPIRGDCNAMYDLATHDIYMINHLLESRPISVFASGKSYVKKGIEDVVSMILNYPNNIQANITSSWIDPNKKRVMTIVGDKKMIELDDVATNKVIIYDKGASYQPKTDGFGEFQLAVRDGDILIPKIAGNEPLKDECKDFLDSIKTGKQPVASGTTGYETVVILDAGKKSMDRNELMRIEYINTQSI